MVYGSSMIRGVGMVVFALACCSRLWGQHPSDDPTQVEYHRFVNYDTNTIFRPGGAPLFPHFFGRLDTLLFRGEGQVHIVHLGGSHIQTDVYPHQVRRKLQQLQPGMHGGRGLIFPVALTGSNNPVNFGVSFTGNWRHCRNTQRNASCNYGLAGMMAVTGDSLATITIVNRDTSLPFGCTTIRVYHYDPSGIYRVGVVTEDPWLVHSVEEQSPGLTLIHLNASVDTFTLEFYKTSNGPAFIELYGIEPGNPDPGVVYTALGVNGATIPAYLRANLLHEQLAMIRPDLIILSFGTNDGYSTQFDPVVFERNYARLITTIKDALPYADILLTVPNDVYLRRRRANPATVRQEEVIYRLAETYNCGIWNFFRVMGGLNSSPQWHAAGMMQNDRIHFTRQGYMLKGDLLFSAMITSYGNHLEQKNNP